MILALEEFLKRAAQRNFEPGYLLAGSELFFRDRFREALAKFYLEGAAGAPDSGELVEHDLAAAPVRNALDDAASFGLFAQRRVLWLRNAEALLARRGASASGDDSDGDDSETPQTASRHSVEAITAYFEKPQPGSVVVFEATSLDLADRDGLRKVERLEKLLPVPCVRLDHPAIGQAARYLSEEAGRRGFTLEQDAAPELVEACAGDLARARVELEKLLLYAAGRSRVTSADIEALVPEESSFTLFEISDAIGDRDTPRALRLVGVMLQQNTPPLLVASLIAGQVRKLLKSKEGAREWIHPKVRDQARKFTTAELTKALEKLFETDVALRSSPPDERVVLEGLVMDLARKR